MPPDYTKGEWFNRFCLVRGAHEYSLFAVLRMAQVLKMGGAMLGVSAYLGARYKHKAYLGFVSEAW